VHRIVRRPVCGGETVITPVDAIRHCIVSWVWNQSAGVGNGTQRRKGAKTERVEAGNSWSGALFRKPRSASIRTLSGMRIRALRLSLLSKSAGVGKPHSIIRPRTLLLRTLRLLTLRLRNNPKRQPAQPEQKSWNRQSTSQRKSAQQIAPAGQTSYFNRRCRPNDHSGRRTLRITKSAR
jgi:hypothetical protein